MEKLNIAGVEIHRIPLGQLLLNRTMLLGYLLFALALAGTVQLFSLRYFSGAATVHDIGLNPTSPALSQAMHEAIFGHGGEVQRTLPWTLIIANYMYMVYTGSGVIFLVAIAELMQIRLVARAAAGFLVVGLSMIFAGLFTIATDLNMVNMLSMLQTPNVKAGIWLMLPLYCTYIPFVLFEIYLLLCNRRILARRLALPILVLSIIIDLSEYYIQARLFAMNTARQLWTEFPLLTFYFIVSAFVCALGVMGVNIFLAHRREAEFRELMELVRKALLICIFCLGLYEIVGYMTVNKDWAFIILFGPFSAIYFLGYILLTLALPFTLLLKSGQPLLTLMASLSVIVGGFIGRCLFVYGGNANPMSNRFGTGYERYGLYNLADPFIYLPPHWGEYAVVIGSIGVALIIYKLFDGLLSVGTLREH